MEPTRGGGVDRLISVTYFYGEREKILTETWDEHVSVAVCESREDLDPIKNILTVRTLWAKSAHISRIGSSHPPPSTPEWLSLEPDKI
jgi:hypothetical protein